MTDAPPVHVSPSQLETRRGCERKWWYSRNRPRHSTPATIFGTRMHAILEDWLRDGTPPPADEPEGKAALASLHLLPMPGVAVVELSVDTVIDGVLWKPRIDWHVPPYLSTAQLLFGDHKSTRDLDYAKTPEMLRSDPQVLGYGRALLERYPHVTHLIARWTYTRRPSGRTPAVCMPVDVEMGVDELRERFAHLHQTEVLPLVQRAHLPLTEHARNLEHCGAYGGCPYRDECLHGVSPLDVFSELMHTAYTRGTTPPNPESHTMQIPASLASVLGLPTTTPPSPVAAPEPTPVAIAIATPPASIDLSGLPDDMVRWCQSPPPGVDVEQVVRHYRASLPEPVVEPEPVAVVEPEPVVERVGWRSGETRTAPEPIDLGFGDHRGAPEPEHRATTVFPTDATRRAIAEQYEAHRAAPPAAAQPAPEPEPEPVTPPKRGRGRPNKSSAAKLLEACAAGGLPSVIAAEYLELLAEVES